MCMLTTCHIPYYDLTNCFEFPVNKTGTIITVDGK